MIPKSLCIYPWVHAAVDINGLIRPCCRFVGNKGLPDISEGMEKGWKDGEFYRTLRQKMLNNEQIDGCKKCYAEEASSGKSMRTNALDDWFYDYDRTIEDLTLQPLDLQYVEFAFSHHCNLACRMCNESYSSKWLAIKRHTNTPLEEEVFEDLEFTEDWFNTNLSELTEVKFVGGEPLLAKQHVQFLTKLLDQKVKLDKLHFYYHTNATVTPNQKVLDFWKQLKKIDVVLSIDGYGKRNEILRPGNYVWQDIVNTIEFYQNLIKQGYNINLRVHTVVTRYNIMHLDELILWLEQKGIDEYSMDIARRPAQLAIVNMNKDQKAEAIEYLNKSNEVLVEYKNRIMSLLEKDYEVLVDENIILEKEKIIDDYFNQDIREVL